MRKITYALYGVALVVLVAVGLVTGLIIAPHKQTQNEPLEKNLRLYGAAQLFSARVLSSSSATAVLQQWCADHQLAPDPKIVARPAPGAVSPVTDKQREELKVNAAEIVTYRRVRLMCGKRLLSEAENWYVPSRLTSEMNHQLETTTSPFGTVVKPLNPSRTTLGTMFMWNVLPRDWERQENKALRQWAIKHRSETTYKGERTLISHDAVLTRSSDGLPISRVRENYKQALLAFMR